MHATLLMTLALLAQTPNQKSPTAIEPVRLTGCISQKPQGSDYTFTDAANGSRYRLTGKDIKKYAGKRVEVVEGAAPKGFAIKGGLYPSPNVAAQAGALDPVQAGIATQPGSGANTGTGEPLPEFRAGRVRTVEGGCQ